MSKATFDAEGWASEILKARDETKPSQEEDKAHMAKLQLWTAILFITGLAFGSCGSVSLVSMVLLALFKSAQFAILAHHSLHGGWGIRRRGWFAKGTLRRIRDWLDWIIPEAWNIEHNKIHHYKLNEDADPDRPDRNFQFVREVPWSLPAKYAFAFVAAGTWKWFYYASNTLKCIHERYPGAPKNVHETMHTMTYLFTQAATGDRWYLRYMLDFVVRDMGPPFLLQYVLYPCVLNYLRGLAGLTPSFWCAIINIAGAELLANLHQFAVIVTNHGGSDLYTFKDPCKAETPEFYLRAVLGSCAYHAGNDWIDYFHGYLNYQVEHHSFPADSPLHYQRLHPRFKQICAKHGIKYVQDPVWTRVKKTVDVMVGVADMPEIAGQAVDQPEIWMMKAPSKHD